MKTISIALKAHIALETTSLVTCWRVSQVLGSPVLVIGFTDHDKELLIEGLVYSPPAGYDPTDVASSSDLAVDNVDLSGILTSPSITEDDLRAGWWDFAQVELFMVNWADLSQGKMYQRYGRLGQVSVGRGTFNAELRGLLDYLKTSIGQLTQAGCRHTLGDAGCQVDLNGSPSLTVTGTIDSVSADGIEITDAERTEPSPAEGESGYFEHGKITITSGANQYLSMEVKAYEIGLITLHLPFPYTLTAGTTYSMHAGCDLLHTTCRDRFDNMVNFDGEWMLPGNDKMVQVARSD